MNAAAALETLLRGGRLRGRRAPTTRARGCSSLEKHDPDVVLTDLRMPGMDGIELLAKIKEMRPETMVILMTAYGTVKTAVKAMKLGAEDYLGKPIDVEELEVVLQKALEKKGLLEEARVAARAARAQVPPRQPGGREPGDARGLQDHPPGGALARLRAAPRRERHRQGALRPGPPPEQPRGAASPSSRWPAPPCPRRSSRASSSATRRAPSPAPSTPGPAASRPPTAAPSSSTRSATSPPPCR